MKTARKDTCRKIAAVVTVSILMAALTGPARGAAASVAVPDGAVDVLSPQTYWRWFLTLRKPVIPLAELKAAGQKDTAPRVLAGRVVPPPYNTVDHQASPAPPKDWDQPSFDDWTWPRSRLPWLRGNAFGRFSSAILCLRGRFKVTGPAAVKGLFLKVRYYGGVRVLLNGREVARQHLPAGELAADTPAEMHPKDVYLDAKGKAVMGNYCTPVAMRKDKDRLARIARRVRVLGPIKLPAGALKRGENLLTVEVRRSEYPYLSLRWFKQPEGRTKPFWVPMNLFNLRLQAVGEGVSPNVARPKGLQVWSENTNDRITVYDYGDPVEGPRPARIAGARSGSFCGQLVIGSDKAFETPKVTVGDLRAVKGGGVIPASRVTLLYARPDKSFRGLPTWFDGLQPNPPAKVAVSHGGALLPVLVRIAVPRDAAAGAYRGTAIVSVGGAEVTKLPIELSVADWIVPNPKDYRTYVGVYQSPTSLAMQYKVKE